MLYGSKIVSTGLGVPTKLITNDDLAKIVDTNDEWIRTRTGIRERKIIDRAGGETITDLCVEAAEQALRIANWSANDVDLLISATISPETYMPNNSARVMGRLGMTRGAGFDQSAACGGFITALHTGDALIRAGFQKKVMLIGADVLSAAINMTDRTTCVLFGDGAGCALLERVENPDLKKDSVILGSKIFTDFDAKDSLAIAGGGSRAPSWDVEGLKKNSPYISMNGQDVFKFAVKGMVKAATEVLQEHDLTAADIKWFVPHQANLRIIEMTAKYLEVPMERVFVNIDRWANTSAATVAIALAEMEQQKLLERGDLLLLDVFGGGFNYGAALVRW